MIIPHLGQQAVLDSQARYRIVAAGRRWGKLELCRMIMEDHWQNGVQGQMIYIAPSYRMIDSARKTIESLVDTGMFLYTATPDVEFEEEQSVDLMIIDEP